MIRTEKAETLTYRTLVFVSSFLARLPARFSLGLGSFLGGFIFYFSKRRRSAYADIKAAFGNRYTEKSRWKLVRAHYCNLGKTAMEIIRFPSLDRGYVQKMVEIQGFERYTKAVEEKKGAILLTGHFGNWELLQIISGLLGNPIYVLAQDQKLKKLNEMLNRLRESHGSVAVSKGIGIRELYRALKKKKIIGLLGDRDAGKHEGVILPFLGRKTTVPTGAFEMARRSGAPILPCFIARGKSGKHEIFVSEAIECGKGDYEISDLIPHMKRYLEILEDMITVYPDQWLWASKRWKYSWTKRILVLSDGKKGHLKQAQSIAKRMAGIEKQYGRPGMEYPARQIEIRYRSPFQRKLFPWFSFLMLPWIQGRTAWLKLFFDKETCSQLENTYADFIISAGSGLIPLNLCLARENASKSIVLMKPSFPFNFLRYDLAVIPVHDRGMMPRESIRTVITPHFVEKDHLRYSALRMTASLRDASRVRYAVFLGGDTRGFRLDLSGIEKLFQVLEAQAKDLGDYIVTTSRRTPESVCQFLKTRAKTFKGCQSVVIASEDSRPEVAEGMMALAEVMIVTEDSISMISEGLSLGKKVVVLRFPEEGLPLKHRRFQNTLLDKSLITLAIPDDLAARLRSMQESERASEFLKSEDFILRERLEAIL